VPFVRCEVMADSVSSLRSRVRPAPMTPSGQRSTVGDVTALVTSRCAGSLLLDFCHASTDWSSRPNATPSRSWATLMNLSSILMRWPSQRSHASYVQAALYLGRGALEGFGCDNTQTPSTRVRPSAVLLPDAPSWPNDPFAWLAFDGRWGERGLLPHPFSSAPTSLLTGSRRTGVAASRSTSVRGVADRRSSLCPSPRSARPGTGRAA
jgi:hypothetical protein